MKKLQHPDIITLKLNTLPELRIQAGITCFREQPSDKYDSSYVTAPADKDSARLDSVELFSIFTADIIKQNAILR